MPFPSIESVKETLRAKGWFEENLIAIGAMVYSGVLVRKCLIVDPPDWPSACTIGALGLFIYYANWSKLQKKRIEVVNQKSVTHLDAAQDTLYDIVLQHWMNKKNKDMDHGLRICVFHHDEYQGILTQLTEYTGEDLEEKKSGRTFSTKTGVIGQCVTTANPAYGRRSESSTMEDFIKEAARDYNYSAKEIYELSSDRYAWIAMPVIVNSKVRAVLYCDSKLENFFGDKNKPRYNIIASAALGLARHFRRD
ncbi:hypothetical protein [Gimesia sp.]|uniref:hypothetical protein n=1 Tax=Gimesia sp. TaxID=2024833 RepID=UPI003A9148B9